MNISHDYCNELLGHILVVTWIMPLWCHYSKTCWYVFMKFNWLIKVIHHYWYHLKVLCNFSCDKITQSNVAIPLNHCYTYNSICLSTYMCPVATASSIKGRIIIITVVFAGSKNSWNLETIWATCGFISGITSKNILCSKQKILNSYTKLIINWICPVSLKVFFETI